MGRDEGDKLLNALLPFAPQMLTKHGEFHPFGAYLNSTGETNLLAAYDADERPAAQTLIEMMVESLRKDAIEKGYQAVGICFDVLVIPQGRTNKSDAIQMTIEYADGEAVNVYLPYKKKWLGKIQYGTTFASSAESRVFKKPE